MAGFLTCDLTAETDDDDSENEAEEETWDNAFQSGTVQSTPVKARPSTRRRGSVSSKGSKTPKKTPAESDRRRSASSSKSRSRRKSATPNVFEGLVREIESDVKRTERVADSPSSEEAVPVLEGEALLLVVQNKEQLRVAVRTSTACPFHYLFSKYRAHAIEKGWISSEAKLTFLWEDMPISRDKTAEDLDCEDGDIIDVISSD